MRAIAMIPARYAATRFPFKLMQPLGVKSVIRTTYDNTVTTGLFDDVIVVTDHAIIFEEISKYGGRCIMSKREHESGTDRIAEAAADLDADVILNVQGDEPFVNKKLLGDLLDVFRFDELQTVQVASPVRKITEPAQINNPNIVKVAMDNNMRSLLFSRSPIPFHRDTDITPVYWEHIGIYAFRKNALLDFPKMAMTPLEKIEKIECLRFLENGIQLQMIETDDKAVKIDVPDDLAKAEEFLRMQSYSH